jgi:TPP-dependent pyruvate/acetoin dehydrogenase alpha subunit
MMTKSVADLELFEKMYLIRTFEETVQSLFQKGEIVGTTHLYSGQEAVATGFASALKAQDLVAATYRGHGHALATGVSTQSLMDEMLGRASGVCGGRSGSMNVIDLKNRLIGCFGIIGGSIGAATGAAISLARKNGVAISFFGDGAINQAYFYECLNFAAVRKLPVIFVCENNLYGEYTPWEDVTAGGIRARAQALEVKSETIDGNDVWKVQQTALESFEYSRNGNGPVFIEALTYRFVGHSRSDPAKYRKPGELDAWKLRDPLLIARKRLISDFGYTNDEIDSVEKSVNRAMDVVRENSLKAPFPDLGRLGSEFKEFNTRGGRSK